MGSKLFSNILVTVSGKFGTMGIQLITTIVLARYLTPNDFGIVAMCSVFLSISEMLIDSGMAGSIIYYDDVKEEELHSVFWTNLVVSVFIYIVLFFISGPVAVFYNVPILEDIIKVIGISIILHSFCLIQSALISKELLFKLQNKILLISAVLSSFVVVGLAYYNMGLWALVAQPIMLKIFQVVLYYIYGSYIPKFYFSIDLIKRHWQFGSRLLASSMLKLIYDNIYIQVIGKVINIRDAGYYSQAKRFNDIPTKLIAFPLERVIFPNLVRSNDMLSKMKSISSYFTLVIVPLLFLGALVSDNLIIMLLGKKWIDSGWMLSFLFIGGIGVSIEALTRNFIKASGKTNVLLRYDIYKRIINLVILAVGIYWGIKGILFAFIFNSLVGWLINGYALNLVVAYRFKEQVVMVVRSVFIAIIPYMIIRQYVDLLLVTNNILILVVKVLTYLFILIPLVFIFQKPLVLGALKSLKKSK